MAIDRELQGIFKRWKEEAKYSRVVQWKGQYKDGKIELLIFTARPGILIGKHGVWAKKYYSEIKKVLPEFEKFTFVETAYLWA